MLLHVLVKHITFYVYLVRYNLPHYSVVCECMYRNDINMAMYIYIYNLSNR